MVSVGEAVAEELAVAGGVAVVSRRALSQALLELQSSQMARRGPMSVVIMTMMTTMNGLAGFVVVAVQPRSAVPINSDHSDIRTVPICHTRAIDVFFARIYE